jgi:hypothetical protein
MTDLSHNNKIMFNEYPLSLRMDVELGYSIENAAKEAVRIAKQLNCVVRFKFNYTMDFKVTPKTDPASIVKKWMEKEVDA